MHAITGFTRDKLNAQRAIHAEPNTTFTNRRAAENVRLQQRQRALDVFL